MAIERKRNRNRKYSLYFCLKNSRDGGRTASAAAHASYLNRRSGSGFKVLHQSARLPRWADDSGYKFFKAADKYEPKGSISYSEFEFSLPSALTLEHNLELAADFIQKVLPDKYYMLTLHKKEHALICYIMFSARSIDAHEMRPVQQFFARVNNKNPEAGGAKKDALFSKKSSEKKFASIYLALLNSKLAEYGVAKAYSEEDIAGSYRALCRALKSAAEESKPADKAGAVRFELEKIQRQKEKLQKQLADLLSQEKRLQDRLAKLTEAGRPLDDIEFELAFDAIAGTGRLKVSADDEKGICAYSAEQIKGLLAILSYMLQLLMQSGSKTASSVLGKLAVLKKAANLQIIKDKYASQKGNAPLPRYFVDEGGRMSHADVHPAEISGSVSASSVQDRINSVSLEDLKCARIIAEAFADNENAVCLTRQIKNDEIKPME